MSNDDPRHGSEAGYSAHMRTDRTPCQACREAKSIVNAARIRYRMDRNAALRDGHWEIDRRRHVQVWVPDVPVGATVIHPSEWRQIERDAS